MRRVNKEGARYGYVCVCVLCCQEIKVGFLEERIILDEIARITSPLLLLLPHTHTSIILHPYLSRAYPVSIQIIDHQDSDCPSIHPSNATGHDQSLMGRISFPLFPFLHKTTIHQDLSLPASHQSSSLSSLSSSLSSSASSNQVINAMA